MKKTGTSSRFWGNVSGNPYMLSVEVHLKVTYSDDQAQPKGYIIVHVNYQTTSQRTQDWEGKFTSFPVSQKTPELIAFLKTLERVLARRCKPGELKGVLAFIKREVVALQDPLPRQAAAGKKTSKK